MRLRIAVAFAFVLVVLADQSWAEPFPSIGYTTADNTAVRSGPGEKFYKTEHLAGGSKVKIYTAVADWFGIRPPEGSFSWVEEKHLTTTSDPAIGKVVTNDARTHVGSRLSKAHAARYLRLRSGETVELLGKELLPARKGKTSWWYKITPPAGEYRWIRRDQISDAAPEEAGRTVAQLGNEVEEPQANLAVGWEPVKREKQTDLAVSDTIEKANFVARRSSDEPAANRVLNESPQTVPVRSTRVDSSSPPADEAVLDRSDQVSSLPPAKPSTSARLMALDVELSLALAQNSNLATFERLQHDVRSHLTADATSDDQAFGQRLLAKIARFQDIQNRRNKLTRTTAGKIRDVGSDDILVTLDLPVPASSTDTPNAIQTVSKDGDPGDVIVGVTPFPSVAHVNHDAELTSYEELAMLPVTNSPQATLETETTRQPASQQISSSGWLVPVITTGNLPGYALTNREGQVVQFVTMAQGIDIQPFLDRPVLVTGSQGESATLPLPFIKVEHASDIRILK